jgi:hypothetical protein
MSRYVSTKSPPASCQLTLDTSITPLPARRCVRPSPTVALSRPTVTRFSQRRSLWGGRLCDRVRQPSGMSGVGGAARQHEADHKEAGPSAAPCSVTHQNQRSQSRACLSTCRPGRRPVAHQRAVECGEFLDSIDEAVAPAQDIHPVLDNYATHKTPLSRRCLSMRRRLNFTPTGAPWLNLVERWFATLTENKIRRGVQRSTRA